MTVDTFFSGTGDGHIQSNDGTYANARSGGGTASLSISDTGTEAQCGQRFSVTYFCYEYFIGFDTSSIPDTDTINSVTLSLYGQNDLSTTDFTLEARLHDWGGTLATTDWVAGANIATKTLLATFATSGFSTSAYNVFTSDAAFVNNINVTGTTYIMVSSLRHSNGTTPGGEERVVMYCSEQAATTQDPKLVVDHSAGAGGTVLDPMGMSGFFGG